MYVIYNETNVSVIASNYTTEGGAKRGIAALKRKGRNVEHFKICTQEEFDALPVPMVTVKNLLSGKDVQIPARDVSTCNDPSQERYHSM